MNSEEFKCIFCKETFDDKETLQVHFRKHGDKNFHPSKVRSNYEPPALPDKPESSKDQAELVECDVCPEMFTSISKAITHKHKVHPDHDAKYFCPWCGKLFTMKHLYNKHIHTTHKNDEMMERHFHCDVCNVDFNSPIAVMYHNKFFHRIFEMPTIGNSKKIKIINQESIQIYYCPFCGEEYDNKINLHKHMEDDHNDENQNPDDVLRCPVCDALFYHLDAYELHLTYHCVDDTYSERSEIIDDITEFSLETVPPLAEKVESLETHNEDGVMGIEQLFEMSIDDPKSKKKKHKKHKKSKKSAITLDQFLNMNTDVFGEGLDFQGIEEVPSQIIAKRLKKPVKKPVQSKLAPDIEKLQRQGIVIKKKTCTKTVKPSLVQSNSVINKTNKIDVKTIPQPLTTPNDVLTKLFNQNNSQIKIVKKSNIDVKSTNENRACDEKVLVENTEPNGTQPSSYISKDNDVGTENDKKTGDPAVNIDANNTTKESSNIENDKSTCSGEESDHSQSILDNMNEEMCVPHTDKAENAGNKLTALRNNSNIVLKSSNQHIIRDVNITKTANSSQDLNENVEDTDINGASKKNDSLNAIKHLGHLTVNSCNQVNKPTSKVENKPGFDKIVEQAEVSKIAHLIRNSPAKLVTNPVKISSSVVPQTNSQLKPNDIKLEKSYFNSDNDYDETSDKTVTNEEPVQTNKLASILNSPHLSIQAIKKTPNVLTQKELISDVMPNNEKSNTDLLKHLKNVTAKSVAANKNLNVSTPSQISPKLVNTIKKDPVAPPVKHSKIIQEDIEIFNIDDSDSDETSSSTVQKPENKETQIPNKPVDVLKNINKNITVKSVNNHNTSNKNVDKAQVKEFDSDGDYDEIDDKIHRSSLPSYPRNSKLNCPLVSQKQSALNNVLKNLSKNITVKSGNTSPAHFSTSQDHSPNSHFEDEGEGAESGTDSNPGGVKITEMDNNASEEDDRDHTDVSDTQQDNVKVQYPDDSNSDSDEPNHNEEIDENLSDGDIEAHIATNAVKKTIYNPKLDNLQNVCKDLVIKPSGSQAINTLNLPTATDEIPAFAKSLSNQISIRNFKQADNCNRQIKTNSSNTKIAEQIVGRSMNKSAVNQKMSTVNKEVKTVKTFQTQTQTKTVIKEITTTVTKTIKTVNQSSKQEIRNSGQSSFTPKKIQHANANNVNFQGVKVRQSTPIAGPRVRMRPTRPALVATVRPSNQLVPVRFNTPRQCNPRMPVVRPSTSGQATPLVGAQVKVSPGMITTNTKRTNEAPGHFSCFKKPKESLFPEADFPTMSKPEGDSAAQFSSTMSKSNIACTTKTVKGNSVVISTQMKSEMCASSQQLGKLRNLSGLSIMKTSQANQSYVVDKSEISAAKQNTLDAIQKLQSQGLLVKKPRLASEESEHSNPGSDENFSDDES